MRVKKLESMRVVENYVEQRRREKALAALKLALDRTKTLKLKEREACKFRLFRYTYLIKRAAFKSLQEYTNLMKTEHLPEKSPQRKVITELKNNVHRPIKTAKQRYWALWRKQIKKRQKRYRPYRQKVHDELSSESNDEVVVREQESGIAMLCVRMSQEARKSKELTQEFN